MTDDKWARLLAYVTGQVNQKLPLQNEYLAAENRVLRAHLPARIRLPDLQRSTLAEIGTGTGSPQNVGRSLLRYQSQPLPESQLSRECPPQRFAHQFD